MESEIIVASASVFGLMIGSAINALVWRLYVGRSWVKGRSMCPECKHELAPRDLVPVLSWVLLRGKCRYCKVRIHWQYPVVELLAAALFGMSAYQLQLTGTVSVLRLAFWLIMLVLLIILAVYDARWMILPNKVMYPLLAVALVFVGCEASLAHSAQVALGAIEASILVGGAFLGIVVLTKGRAMGGGDIKLAFAMGLMLGLQATAVAMLLAFNVAAAVGLTMIVLGKRGRRDQIPFGPYLVGGTILAFLFGRQIVAWYLRLNGLA